MILEKMRPWWKLDSGSSRPMAYIFCVLCPKLDFRRYTPQSQSIVLNFIILLDSSYDFGENKVLFLKIGARVPDVWLDTTFGLRWPKCNF